MTAGSQQVKQSITKALDLPAEILMDLPRLIITGRQEFYAENHRGILLYTHDHIRFATRLGAVDVRGVDMELKSIATEQLIITGRIEKVELAGGEE